MTTYHVPKTPSIPSTIVMIKGYQVDNPTSFEVGEKKGESQLTLHLTFISNDYSPDKFTKFLDAFNNFLMKYSCENQ
ncbi:hypothetical protein HNQ34_001782 [Anoxybacillus tepidamans]|uniref:Uncharacterized protein n=1 Tax=Anoxybacteroides tepidamans TaxID=265948 RepID=A0A7W8IS42_9BACL|nr:hypothetical protein [Anoxybacillus tepidamans]MBB5324684.1 hypothetical protein [Anoxybacillus tepidamans]